MYIYIYVQDVYTVNHLNGSTLASITTDCKIRLSGQSFDIQHLNP